jgi:hypothetical protein
MRVHYALRPLIHAAAENGDLDPDRISFTKAMRAARRSVRTSPTGPVTPATALHRAITEIPHPLLPNRRLRANAHAVRRKMSSYNVKRAQHRNRPTPTQPIANTVRVLTPTRSKLSVLGLSLRLNLGDPWSGGFLDRRVSGSWWSLCAFGAARSGGVGFRCTGWGAEGGAKSAKPSADAAGGELAGLAGPFPGQALVVDVVAGQAQLGVGGDDEPGPTVGLLGGAQRRGCPAEGVLDEPAVPAGVETPERVSYEVPARSPSPDRWTGACSSRRRSTSYARGSRVETIFPDSNSEHMFGANAMDLSLRPPAARAGYDQGKAHAEQLTEFWR